jgi:hypothetical protein
VTRGAVTLPGEAIATIAGGGSYLRLALPERHARALKTGATVELATNTAPAPVAGRIAKIYPQMEQGRVIADVEITGLNDDFVGERVLVRVPVGERHALAVPAGAIMSSAGLDHVRISGDTGPRTISVIVGGEVTTPSGPRVEILSGLRSGDRVIVP